MQINRSNALPVPVKLKDDPRSQVERLSFIEARFFSWRVEESGRCQVLLSGIDPGQLGFGALQGTGTGKSGL